MVRRTIYLVRHGQHQRIEPDEPHGHLTMEQANQLDGGLTSLGIEQAELTAQRLSAYPISAVHCSSLPRATHIVGMHPLSTCHVGQALCRNAG